MKVFKMLISFSIVLSLVFINCENALDISYQSNSSARIPDLETHWDTESVDYGNFKYDDNMPAFALKLGDDYLSAYDYKYGSGLKMTTTRGVWKSARYGAGGRLLLILNRTHSGGYNRIYLYDTGTYSKSKPGLISQKEIVKGRLDPNNLVPLFSYPVIFA
jgi:hypothetical protein